MTETQHLSRAVLQQLLAHDTVIDLTAANDHLRQCQRCREEFRAVAAEQMPAAALLFAPPAETDDFSFCLETDEAVRFVAREMDDLEREAAQFHLEECDGCRSLIAELEAFAAQMEREALLTPENATEPIFALTQPLSVLKTTLDSWISGLELQAARLLESLRPPTRVLGFASAEAESQRETLTFDTPDIFGSSRLDGENRRLHFEHLTCPPGTLAVIETADTQNRPTWHTFAVFRRGMQRSILNLSVPAEAEITTLHIGITASLPAEFAAHLPECCGKQLHADPASRNAWESWADQTLQADSNAEMHRAAEAVLALLQQH